MRENPFQDPYDLGYADGKYMAEQRIAELEAENAKLKARELGFIQSLNQWEAENARLMEHIDELEEIIAFQTIQVDEMEAQIAKLREAAQAVVDADLLPPAGDYYHSESDQDIMNALAALLEKPNG